MSSVTSTNRDPIQADLAEQFTALIQKIENYAGARFRHLDPEARQEAIQNVLALAWFRFLDLAAAGKHEDAAVVDSMIYWSIIHTSQGRRGHGCDGLKAKCALDYGRRGKAGVKVDRLNLDLHVSLESPVPTQAAFRVDTPAWLATLTDRNREIAIDLGLGYSTGEVAKRSGVSPARVSQLRREFVDSYHEFHDEAA
jgi:hypothetical protein